MPARSRASLRHAGWWKSQTSSKLPALAGLVLVLGACAPGGQPEVSPPPLVVTDGADGSTQTMRPGQPMEVRLPGNPSTGFRWEANAGEQAVLRQEGEPQFERGDAPAGVVGAGGTEVFRFMALASGTQDLSFVYRRAWETDLPPARTVAVRIIVKDR
jgi:inhibitor of cysteine peptidase